MINFDSSPHQMLSLCVGLQGLRMNPSAARVRLEGTQRPGVDREHKHKECVSTRAQDTTKCVPRTCREDLPLAAALFVLR